MKRVAVPIPVFDERLVRFAFQILPIAMWWKKSTQLSTTLPLTGAYS